MTNIDWRLGLEVELLAPVGKSRFDLAQAIARHYGGTLRRTFHPQSEPSKVPGLPVFHNLTLGFEVNDSNQQWVASCVDDLTLQADLNPQTEPKPDWYRVLSDDLRLLHLIQCQTDPERGLAEVLEPIANLFGTLPQPGPGGMVKVNDSAGASVAIAAPLPGERERPCELVTAPIDRDHQQRLDTLLGLAKSLGFVAPKEGATHLHFDATPLHSASALANLVQILWAYGEPLKQLMGTNPNCIRLGAWPPEVAQRVALPDFRTLDWDQARAELLRLNLIKYCDFNLLNCLQAKPCMNTIEVRILPVWLESQPILEAASLFVAILRWAISDKPVPALPPEQATAEGLLSHLDLCSEQKTRWLAA